MQNFAEQAKFDKSRKGAEWTREKYLFMVNIAKHVLASR